MKYKEVFWNLVTLIIIIVLNTIYANILKYDVISIRMVLITTVFMLIRNEMIENLRSKIDSLFQTSIDAYNDVMMQNMDELKKEVMSSTLPPLVESLKRIFSDNVSNKIYLISNLVSIIIIPILTVIVEVAIISEV
ncbi:MAG TPA: hypothetical protein PLC53_02855 [Bacilli bacterium]|nr:hypothetical protein [Bacilli bacterium]